MMQVFQTSQKTKSPRASWGKRLLASLALAGTLLTGRGLPLQTREAHAQEAIIPQGAALPSTHARDARFRLSLGGIDIYQKDEPTTRQFTDQWNEDFAVNATHAELTVPIFGRYLQLTTGHQQLEFENEFQWATNEWYASRLAEHRLVEGVGTSVPLGRRSSLYVEIDGIFIVDGSWETERKGGNYLYGGEDRESVPTQKREGAMLALKAALRLGDQRLSLDYSITDPFLPSVFLGDFSIPLAPPWLNPVATPSGFHLAAYLHRPYLQAASDEPAFEHATHVLARGTLEVPVWNPNPGFVFYGRLGGELNARTKKALVPGFVVDRTDPIPDADGADRSVRNPEWTRVAIPLGVGMRLARTILLAVDYDPIGDIVTLSLSPSWHMTAGGASPTISEDRNGWSVATTMTNRGMRHGDDLTHGDITVANR